MIANFRLVTLPILTEHSDSTPLDLYIFLTYTDTYVKVHSFQDNP